VAVILDEAGLRWQILRSAMGPHGEECVQRGCVQHKRITSLTQRPNADAGYVTLYYVDGLANQYHTPAEALRAMRENPA
jgi:hypothetical protein